MNRAHRYIPQPVPKAHWVKSTASNPSGECVELTKLPDATVIIRHSHYPDGVWLYFGREAVRAFICGGKAGGFDHLVAP